MYNITTLKGVKDMSKIDKQATAELRKSLAYHAQLWRESNECRKLVFFDELMGK